jgi:hypothetical protein
MTKPTDGFKMIDDVLKGLKKAKRQEEWGFQFWPFGIHELHGRNTYYDDKIDVFWKTQFRGYYNPTGINADKEIKIKAALINDKGKIISIINSSLICRMGIIIFEKQPSEPYKQKRIIVQPENVKRNLIFQKIDAGDITEGLSINIVEVNGINAEDAVSTGYIKISQGNI